MELPPSDCGNLQFKDEDYVAGNGVESWIRRGDIPRDVAVELGAIGIRATRKHGAGHGTHAWRRLCA